jgi:spoIIIJ-associated protein
MSNKDSVEVTSATVEQAISEGLAQLGAAEDDVVIEVLATPRSGLLGLGARDARVRVSRRTDVAATSGVTAPPPAPPPQRREQAASTPRPETPRRETPPASPPKAEAAPARQAQPPRPPREPRPEREREQPRRNPPRNEPSRNERAPESGAEDFAAESGADDVGDGDRRSANLDEQVKEASELLAQILELMNEKSEIRRGEGDRESLELEIKGDGSGILIGRHGQTLDALEYLLNRIVARRIKDAMPILLDTESYRARRRQQLHRMALSIGERAKREHEAIRLDPMPPRDRRIVHLALKDDPMITTRSAGEGFLRSVEVVPVEGQGQRERRGGGGRENNRRDREREPERPREREPERPRERERPAPAPAPSGQSTIGEQGGFKHGQKRLF